MPETTRGDRKQWPRVEPHVQNGVFDSTRALAEIIVIRTEDLRRGLLKTPDQWAALRATLRMVTQEISQARKGILADRSNGEYLSIIAHDIKLIRAIAAEKFQQKV